MEKPLRTAEITLYDNGSYTASLTNDGRGVGGWAGTKLVFLGKFKTFNKAVKAIQNAFKENQ